MTQTNPDHPLPQRLLEMLGFSLLGFAAFAVLSSLGSFIVFRESWLGQGLGRALLSQLTSPWLISEAAYFVLLPAAVFGVERFGPRRAALRWPLLVLAIAIVTVAVQLAVAGIPGAGAVTALLTMLLAILGATPCRRLALGLLLPVAYGLFVIGGLMPARGLTVDGWWALGLAQPLSTLAQVLLIEAPRLAVLALLLLRWRAAFQETESP